MLICVFQCVREAADYTRLPPPSSSSKCHLQLNDNDRHSDTVRRRRELRLGGEVGGGRHKKRLGPFFFGARGTKQHGSFECHPLHRDIEAHISFFFSYTIPTKSICIFFMLIGTSNVRTGCLRLCILVLLNAIFQSLLLPPRSKRFSSHQSLYYIVRTAVAFSTNQERETKKRTLHNCQQKGSVPHARGSKKYILPDPPHFVAPYFSAEGGG